MDKRFLTAFVAPDRWCVRGYWLAPYCVDHILKLHALDHPIIKGEVPNPAEVILFLRVCHERRDDLYHLEPNLADKMFVWKMQKNPLVYKEMLDGIAEYIKTYSSVPKMQEDGNSKSQENNPPVPHLLSLVGVLVCKTSITEKEAMRMAFGKVVWYSIAAARIEGAEIKTISTDVEESLEKDGKGAAEHAAKVKEMLRLAMVNGKIPTKKIR